MDTAAGCEEETIEAGFARTVRYIDLYMQQMLPVRIPMMVPYIGGYIQKY